MRAPRRRPGNGPASFDTLRKIHVWLSFTEQKLDFCVGVRADFAVQIDFFVLRCGPFHGYDSLALVEHRKNNTETEQQKAEFKLASKRCKRRGLERRTGSENMPQLLVSHNETEHNRSCCIQFEIFGNNFSKNIARSARFPLTRIVASL